MAQSVGEAGRPAYRKTRGVLGSEEHRRREKAWRCEIRPIFRVVAGHQRLYLCNVLGVHVS